MSIPEESESQYQIFRDCVFEAITNKSGLSNTKGTPSRRRRHSRKGSSSTSEHTPPAESSQTNDPVLDDPSSLADFSDYLATEIFLSLPGSLCTLSYHSTPHDDYSLPLATSLIEDITSRLPPCITDTLTSYSLITPPTTDTTTFLSPILTSYITTLLTPPPPPSSTRPSTNECELCSRTHLHLTYHHLIPKSTHPRCLKRNWHKPEDFNAVAWLCRACHTFVHRMAGNEELARRWFTMERIREGEGVEGWVRWVGGVRWKKR